MKTIFSEKYALLINKLKRVRKEMGCTQADLAARLGTEQSYISKIERSQRRLDVIELRDICAALGVDFVEFVRTLEDEINRSEKT